MNKAKFFAALRARDSGVFGSSISQSQVNGTERILEEAQARGTPLRHLAYILATAYHESAHKMQPVREMGGEKYLRSKRYYPWVGEGLVQITWEENHRKFGATAPGQMMTWRLALKAIFDGMTKGMFTTKKMSDYLDGEKPDYRGARRIVNGMDRAADIAAYALTFEKALRAGEYIGQKPKAAPQPPVMPVPAPIPAPSDLGTTPKPSPTTVSPPKPPISAPPPPVVKKPVLVPATPSNNRNGIIVFIVMAASAILAWLGFGG